MGRLHLGKVLSPDKVDFNFLNENGGNMEGSLDKDLPFINTQEVPVNEISSFF